MSIDTFLAILPVFERGKDYKKNAKKYTQCVQFDPNFSFRERRFLLLAIS
jgi:hypothetical protein